MFLSHTVFLHYARGIAFGAKGDVPSAREEQRAFQVLTAVLPWACSPSLFAPLNSTSSPDYSGKLSFLVECFPSPLSSFSSKDQPIFCS